MENRSALEMPALAQALSLAAVCLPQDGCAYDRITLDIVLATAANLLRHNRPENEVRLAILWQLSASAAEQLVPEHLRPDFKALAVFFDRTLDFLAADEPLEPDDIERLANEILAPIPDDARIVAAAHLKAIVDRSPKRIFYAADRPEPDRALFFTRLLALAKTFAAGTSDLSGERLHLSVKAAIRSARLKQTLLPDEMDDRIWLFQIRQEVPTEKREAILKRLDKFLSALWLKVGCVPEKKRRRNWPLAERCTLRASRRSPCGKYTGARALHGEPRRPIPKPFQRSKARPRQRAQRHLLAATLNGSLAHGTALRRSAQVALPINIGRPARDHHSESARERPRAGNQRIRKRLLKAYASKMTFTQRVVAPASGQQKAEVTDRRPRLSSEISRRGSVHLLYFIASGRTSERTSTAFSIMPLSIRNF